MFKLSRGLEKEIGFGLLQFKERQNETEKRKTILEGCKKVAYEKKQIENKWDKRNMGVQNILCSFLRGEKLTEDEKLKKEDLNKRNKEKDMLRLKEIETILLCKREYVARWIRGFSVNETILNILEYIELSFSLKEDRDYGESDYLSFKKVDGIAHLFSSSYWRDLHKSYDSERDRGKASEISFQDIDFLNDVDLENLHREIITGDIIKDVIRQLYDQKILTKTPRNLEDLLVIIKREMK